MNLKFSNARLEYTDDINNADFVTHNGTFHADEVFSTIILMGVVDKDIIYISRSSDIPNNEKTIVYDVGLGKFDHHQEGGNGMRDNGIKYASCGLVWREFGRTYLENVGITNVDMAWNMVENAIVQDIDSGDNGQADKEKLYDFEAYGVADFVDLFNSNWNEEDRQNDFFIDVVYYMKVLFEKLITRINSKIEAKEIIERSIENSTDQVIVLDKYLPWKDLVLESENPKSKDLLYIIFPSNRGGYSIYAIPNKKGSFDVRKEFPKEWAGLRDEELQKVTGVETARFCHNGRFICTTESLCDAKEIARKAVDYNLLT